MPRQDSFQQERYQIDGSDTARFQDQYDLHRRAPPMVSRQSRTPTIATGILTHEQQQIDEALRSHCGIAAKQYFVAAINDDGLPITFFSPGQKLHDNAIRQFFDASKFQQVMRRIESGE